MGTQKPHPLRCTFWLGLAGLVALAAIAVERAVPEYCWGATCIGEQMGLLLYFIAAASASMFGVRLVQDWLLGCYRRDLDAWRRGDNPDAHCNLFLRPNEVVGLDLVRRPV